MNSKIFWGTLLLLAAGISGCSNISAVEDSPRVAQQPDYLRIISRDLQAGLTSNKPEAEISSNDNEPPAKKARGSVFRDVEGLGRLEISDVRYVQHNTIGWVWLACLRSYPGEKQPTDYAIFMDSDHIVDARTSVITDNCAEQTYIPLALSIPNRRQNEQ